MLLTLLIIAENYFGELIRFQPLSVGDVKFKDVILLTRNLIRVHMNYENTKFNQIRGPAISCFACEVFPGFSTYGGQHVDNTRKRLLRK